MKGILRLDQVFPVLQDRPMDRRLDLWGPPLEHKLDDTTTHLPLHIGVQKGQNLLKILRRLGHTVIFLDLKHILDRRQLLIALSLERLLHWGCWGFGLAFLLAKEFLLVDWLLDLVAELLGAFLFSGLLLVPVLLFHGLTIIIIFNSQLPIIYGS